MYKRTRAERHAVLVTPDFFESLQAAKGFWYETPEEIEAGLAWGQRKAELLRWVRRHMGRRLTLRERRCVELYFFQGLSHQEVADATDTHPTTVQRALARSLRKLRETAARSPHQGLPRQAAPRSKRGHPSQP